jgi:peptide/nickel transport system substrate-binding protein
MQDDKPGRWQRLQKVSFNRKDLSKRMRRAEGATVRHARKFIIRRWSNARDVRQHIILWVVAVGVLIGASGLQLMWYQQGYRTFAAANDGTYAEAMLGPIDTLNPLFAATSAEESASKLLFSRLFTYDTTGHLAGDIASGVTIDPSGTIYTVTIRSDAKWHDGIAITASDVAFTVGLLKNPAVRSTITGWNDITVAAVNDTTLTFKLTEINAAFAHALTFPIVPQHILGKVEPNAIRENTFSNAPIGSGPFKLRFIQDIDVTNGRKIIHMERNTAYFKGQSKLERYQLHIYSTQDAIIRALSSGEVNAAADMSASSTGLVNRDRYDVSSRPINSGVYALINTTRPALSDKAVRQALQRGTDTTAIRALLPSRARSLDLPFINGQLSGDVPKVAAYDKAAAASLLDGAGWKLDGTVRKKDGIELKLSVVTTKDTDFERVLETLVGQWRQLGIVIDTQVVDPTDASQQVVQNVLQPRNFDILLYQLTIGADPDVYAYWHSSQTSQASSHGFNFSNYSNVISDDALLSARSRLEPSLRNTKYLTFARQWVADVPAIGLYQSTAHYVSSNNVVTSRVNNVLIAPNDRYADILYWSVGTRPVFMTP